MNRRTSLVLFFCVRLIGVNGWAQDASPNDQARFLAGLPVRGSALESYTRDVAWAEHATALDAAWGKTEQRQMANVRAWAGEYISHAPSTVYYMFSGPDFLYADLFFPNASTYILCGTEPIGAIPDIRKLAPGTLRPGLTNLRGSLKTILGAHFFITKDMRADLQREELGGTLPVLYLFLARLGNTIREVTFVDSPSAGVRLTFTSPSGTPQILYYFKVDLSNGSGGNFLGWCAAQGPGASLVKAASYLMHGDGFSQVRRFLLDQSALIVQDDSGIPLHYFDERWTVRVFGEYVGPIEIFAKYFQPDLLATYRRSNPAPLRFAFGYHTEPQRGMLMLGTRR